MSTTLELKGEVWYFGNSAVGNYQWASTPHLEGRIEENFGPIDLFVCDRRGRRRGGDVTTVDIDPQWRPHIVADMNALPFAEKSFRLSFFDPPYDAAYKNAWQEVKRVTDETAVGLSHYVMDAGHGWKLAALVPVMIGAGSWHRIRVLTVVRRIEGRGLEKQRKRSEWKRARRARARLVSMVAEDAFGPRGPEVP